MRLLNKLLSVSLLILNISLIIASLAVKDWSTVDKSKDLGLYSCENCGSLKNDWNFECLGRSYCEEEGKSGECSLYKDLYKASYSYLLLEFSSLLLSILFLEKTVLLVFDMNPGPKTSVLATGFLMLLFHVLATILWFAFSEAGYSCKETDFKSRPEICFSQGAALAVANCVLMGVTMTVFLVVFRKSFDFLVPEINPGRILWMPGFVVVGAAIVLVVFSTVLMLASLTVRRWVETESFEGGLVRCQDCDKIEWLAWTCLRETECEINSDSSKCSDYKQLAKASSRFIGLQAATFVFVTLFLQNLTAFLKGRVYGFKVTNYVKNI
jgi:hypothetical protein